MHTHTHTYIHTYKHVHVCIYSCMYIRIHTCTHLSNIHTYTPLTSLLIQSKPKLIDCWRDLQPLVQNLTLTL